MSLLTVAIPTYNRPKNTELILKELLNQYDGSFDVLITDDSSNEEVKEVADKYLDKMPNMRYVKNETNLGFSRNVNKLYELSNTEYVWFLCDDDLVTKDALKEIQKGLNNHKPTVAVFNHLHTDPYGQAMNAGVEHDIIYENIEDLGNDYQPLMRTTFLSTLVVKKVGDISEIMEKDYADNVYFQVTLSLLLLSREFRYAEFAFPVVDRKVGFKYGDFFKFYMVDHLKAVHLIEHSFDNRYFIKWSINNLQNALKLYYAQKLGLFVYQKQPTTKTIKLVVKYYGIYSIPIFFFYSLYYITPAILIKWIYYAKLVRIHGKEKGRGIYNMYIDRAKKDERDTGFVNYI